MKLKNKKTGEIRTAVAREDGIYLYDETTKQLYKFELSLLAEYWDYYEESKEYWYIDCDGDTMQVDDTGDYFDLACKEIGNYFDSEEKAKRAVEKLKAWRRLKDKGFRFNRWTIPEEPKTPHIKLVIEAEMDVPDSPYGLDLLFAGDEE